MCQLMPTTAASCPTIKANASLRRSRRWKDQHQFETNDGNSHCPVGGDSLLNKSRWLQNKNQQLQQQQQQQSNGTPPAKNNVGRRRPNRREQQQHDSSSISTASTEQLSTSSSDDCLSLSFDDISYDASPVKSSTKPRRRRTKKSGRPQTMVVNVPLQRQRSSSSCIDDQDEDLNDDEKSRYLAIDCEMVGIGPMGTTSRLARVAIVNWHGEVVYDAHVRVEEKVTDYRTFVSGITPGDLLESSGAVSFDEARCAVMERIRGRVLVGHGLRNDFAALGIWDHPWHDVRDTARYEPFMRSPGPGEYNPTGAVLVPKKLRTLARDKLGMEIQVEGLPHSPVEDAIAALGLYRRHRSKWERAVMYKVERTREIRDGVDCAAMEANL